MNSADVVSPVGLQEEPIACPQCGSTSRVGRGLCLSCLLYRGLGEETFDNETLESVLQEVDVPDADWRLGNYQILEAIGRGGMGVIYRARQRHSRRIVALKRILAHHAESHDTLVRFRREAEAAASLDHPNILPVYEVSDGEDGLPFFSMKFATGGSLLKNQTILHSDRHRAVGLMAKVARGVAYAHSRNILHRDLKPGNILLDGHGEPMVADFGLAKWLDESSDLTRTLTVFGTPGYIAPEQAHGPASCLMPTADVYSLGAMLFDLLAGRPPFLGEHALSVIEQAKEKPAPKLRSIVPKLDRDLETICARCLEREPNVRYQSAGDLADDLERWIDGRPVLARPVSPLVRIWRWSHRKPKLAASVGGCILGGLIALAFVTFTLLPETSPFHPGIAIPEKSIAVLPFENLSEDKANVYFADGVQDEILTDLAKIADLKVISRTSVMQYKGVARRNVREIAHQLGVAHVVEGSVQRAENRVRVSAQLIDARSDMHLWAEHYDRPLGDVFAIQSEIAKAVADQLQAKLSPREKAAIEQPPTANLAAYDSYVRAKSFLAVSSDARQGSYLYQAEGLLNQAITQDPKFLLAYCKLAYVHQELYYTGFDHSPARLSQANEALRKALELGPDRGEAHLAAVWVYYHCYFDYARARSELEIARSSLPNEPEVFALAGYMDRRQGRWKEHIQNLEKAAQVDPRNIEILHGLAQGYELLRQFPEMAAVLDRILAITPADPLMRVSRASVDFEWHADTRRLHETIKQILAEDPNSGPAFAQDWMVHALCERNPSEIQTALTLIPREGITSVTVRICRPFYEGLAARVLNDPSDAKRAFNAARTEMEKVIQAEPDYPQGLCVLGMIDAALGRNEQAVSEAQRALELLPAEKDPLTHAELLKSLAVVYAWTGDKDAALDVLKKLLQTPAPINYGELRLHPYWEPLRGDRRFEQLIAESAKPVAIK